MATPERAAAPTLTQRLEYGILRLVAAALRPFSWKTASGIGAFIGGLGYSPFRVRAGQVERYIRAAFPEFDEARVRAVARESYRGLGRVTIESILLSREPKEAVLAAFSGTDRWELLEAAVAQGRGVVLVSGHIGSWELSAAYMAARGIPVDAIAMHMANPLSDAFFKRTRERFGVRVLFDDEAVRAIPRSFRDGRAVGFLSDQGAKGLASTYVDFFGRPAKTPRGAAVFAIRSKLPILFIAALRQPDQSYRFIVREVTLAEHEDRDQAVDDTVRNYTKAIEDCVREHPEQYFWQHRRWKRQPPDTPPAPPRAVSYPYDVASIRAREYPWEARGEAVHFDHASIGVIPQRARDAVAAYNDKRAEMHAMRAEDFFPQLDRSRALVAQLIGASADEIALTTNTSWGVNLAAYALPLGPGDTVLGSEGEFPANVYPWMAAAKQRGFTFELVPMQGFAVDESEILRRIETDARVKGVALSWVSFWTGYRIDAKAIGTACRKRGVWFAMDSIQGLGACALDVRDVPVDIVSNGAQKWLCSPWGAAFAYVRRELIAQLEPPAAGWLSQATAGDFAKFLDYDPAWRDDAQRFEVGSLPIQDFVGMNATLELLLAIGPAAIEDYLGGLTGELWNLASSLDGATVLTPPERERRAGIVAFRTRDVAGDSARLRQAGVVHSVREGAIRLAPHFHNLPDDLMPVMDALRFHP